MARSATMPNIPMNEDQQRDLVREVKRIRRENRTLEQSSKLKIADYEKAIDDLREDLEIVSRERDALDSQLRAARLDVEQARVVSVSVHTHAIETYWALPGSGARK